MRRFLSYWTRSGRVRATRSEAVPASRPSWLRYGVAVLAVGVVLLVKLLLDLSITNHSPFLLLAGAVIVGAWFGGLGPGLLATALAAIAADYFFLPPLGSFTGLDVAFLPLLLFMLQGALISWLVEALHSARQRANMSALEARSHLERLRRSEERFRLVVQGVKNYAIFVLDYEGRVVTWNEGAERINGYTAKEIVGKHFSVFYTQEDIERGHAEEELRVAAEEGSYEEEGVRVRKDGSEFWASMLVTALRDEEGNLRGFSKVVRDITDRKEAEYKLRESEELYRSVVEQAAENILLVGVGTKHIIRANAAVHRSLGYSTEELRQLTLYDIVAHDHESIERNVRRILEEGQRFIGERRYRRKDGSLIDVEVNASAISFGGREIICVVAHDITERKKAETRFRTLVEQIPAVTYIQEPIESDNPKTITYMSPQYENMFGYLREAEMVDEEHWLRRLHPEDRKRVLAEEFRTDETGEPFKIEYRVIAADGRVVWVRDLAVLVCNKEGQPLYWLGVQFDVTEQKRAEEDLRRSVNSLLALNEAAQILASSLEREEIALKLLQVTQRMSALEAASLALYDERGELNEWHSVGEKGVLAAVRAQPRARAAAREAAEGGQPRSVELPLPSASGREASWGAAGVFVPLRAHDRVIGVLEAYGPRPLREKESMETLASLASQGASALENARLYEELSERERELQDLVRRILVGQEDERRRVAYDIHDGLTQTAIAAYRRLELFVKHRPPDAAQDREELEDAVALVRQTVGDARRIIANLRPTSLDDFGLATAVRMSLDDLRGEGFKVSYEETLGKKRLPVTLETALFRVAQEALANVRKHAQTKRVHISLGRRDDGMVHLEVRDWGRGFEEPAGAEQRGGGPGERVGLSSMQERVTLLGGSLQVRSEPGKGTAVLAEIPMQQGTLPENEVEGGH